MYKVLFAEDELLVRLGLQNSIPWEKYQMELVAQADNGISAFELFQKIHPDVVITDIRMEGMDGYELIQRIREQDESCAIVVISCLDDFETLRKMIPYKIIGYILKATMTMDEIFQILQKTQKYLENSGRESDGAVKKPESPGERLKACLLLEDAPFPEEEEPKIQEMLLFTLKEEDKEKINSLAMKFVCDLVNRQMPDGILVETGEKAFCVMLREPLNNLRDIISRINRSVEGFLGVCFQVNSGTRKKEETLRALYQRIQKNQDGQAEERQYDNLIEDAVAYMHKHYQETLSLTDISGVVGISSSYFSHLFKKKTGKNYIEYLNEIRLSEVMEELKNSDYKIAAIAEKHGFHNFEYFSRFFKKATGLSPVKWRQQYR